MTLGLVAAVVAGTALGGAAPCPEGLCSVPAAPFRAPDGSERRVAAFALDEHPVTNAEYLEFVGENHAWRRSGVAEVFAESGYLASWAGDLDPGDDPPDLGRRPVTSVSWFAARAYCAWRGKRLPTIAEWELAATGGDEALRPEEVARARGRISRPSHGLPPPVDAMPPSPLGLRGLHGFLWEWVEDFHSVLVVGESRGGEASSRQFFCAAGALAFEDATDYARFLRFAFRSSLEARYVVSSLGFRCARSEEDDSR